MRIIRLTGKESCLFKYYHYLKLVIYNCTSGSTFLQLARKSKKRIKTVVTTLCHFCDQCAQFGQNRFILYML
jgi:hypothetical protein